MQNKTGDVILDIGANDGTFLKNFKKDKIITIGCEPAKNLKNELKKLPFYDKMISGIKNTCYQFQVNFKIKSNFSYRNVL